MVKRGSVKREGRSAAKSPASSSASAEPRFRADFCFYVEGRCKNGTKMAKYLGQWHKLLRGKLTSVWESTENVVVDGNKFKFLVHGSHFAAKNSGEEVGRFVGALLDSVYQQLSRHATITTPHDQATAIRTYIPAV